MNFSQTKLDTIQKTIDDNKDTGESGEGYVCLIKLRKDEIGIYYEVLIYCDMDQKSMLSLSTEQTNL